MARFVVLEFDDNEAAASFVKLHRDLTRGTVGKGTDEEKDVVEQMRAAGVALAHGFVRALLPKPTKFCDCAAQGRITKKSMAAFTKGKKLGWWVHATKECMKPTRQWGSSYRCVISAAVNLLDPEDKENKTIKGWEQKVPEPTRPIITEDPNGK